MLNRYYINQNSKDMYSKLDENLFSVTPGKYITIFFKYKTACKVNTFQGVKRRVQGGTKPPPPPSAYKKFTQSKLENYSLQ